MQKIIANLWFDNEAEEAVDFYTSIFKDSKKGTITRYGKSGAEVSGKPEGSIMTVDFEILGQKFVALNGRPEFKFTEAISFMVECEDQEEIDYYWGKLTEGGDEKAQICGWLKDKYGLSWQIVPRVLSDLAERNEPKKFENMMKALLEMKKLDLKTLMDAYQ